MQVDAVHQGPAQFGLITVNLVGVAAATVGAGTQVSTGARVHGTHQLNTRREFRTLRGTRNRDVTRFQRFAQGFKRRAGKFRQFVQKMNPMVRLRNFSRWATPQLD
jgi:hypothetical protein